MKEIDSVSMVRQPSTLNYWQGWAYLGTSIFASARYTIYLVKYDPLFCNDDSRQARRTKKNLRKKSLSSLFLRRLSRSFGECRQSRRCAGYGRGPGLAERTRPGGTSQQPPRTTRRRVLPPSSQASIGRCASVALMPDVLAPLPYIAVHVVKTPGVSAELSRRYSQFPKPAAPPPA
jgi:hypothetical protein